MTTSSILYVVSGFETLKPTRRGGVQAPRQQTSEIFVQDTKFLPASKTQICNQPWLLTYTLKVGAKSFLLEIIKELHYYKDVKIPTVFPQWQQFSMPVTLALAILQYCYYPSIKSSILRAGERLRGVMAQHEPGIHRQGSCRYEG